MIRRNIYSLSVALILLSLYSCHKDPQKGHLIVHMTQKVGDKALELNKMVYQSPAGHPYQVSKLKYILTEFELADKDGNTVKYEGGHLTDLTDSTSMAIDFEVPPGEYTQFSFTYGLSKANNVKSYLPNTQAYQNMYWPKTLGDTSVPSAQRDPGFHYMQYEGRYDSLGSGVIKVFNLHTGPTYGADNSFVVHLPFSQNVTIDNNTWEVNLVMDLQEWLQNPNLFDYETFGPAIMPQQAAQDLLKANGQTVYSLDQLSEK